jgi:HK97 family phage portal protein
MFGWLRPRTVQFQLAHPSDAGITVTESSALGSATAFACVRIISSSAASLSLTAFKESGDITRIYKDSSVYRLLKSPNYQQTQYQFLSTLVTHLLLYGNAFVLKETLGSRVTALWLLPPDQIQVEFNQDGSLLYHYRVGSTVTTYREDDIIHHKYLSIDGRMGLSPVSVCRNSIGLELAGSKWMSSIMKSGGRPGGILEVPGTLKPEAVDRLRQSWQDIHAGVENAGKVAVLESGIKYSPFELKLADQEFLASRRFQSDEIGRIFGVPSQLLSGNDRPTFNSVENLIIAYRQFTLRPILVNVESTFTKGLFGTEPNATVKFDLSSDISADVKSRMEAYNSCDFMTLNEKRQREGLNPLPGADVLMVPLNEAPLPNVLKRGNE